VKIKTEGSDATLSDLYPSICLELGGPTRSITTPVSIAIGVNEVRIPPTTKR